MTTPLTPQDDARLKTCHVDLQRIVRRVHRERMAVMVICGHRGEREQEDAFKRGTSKLRWPRSRHNSYPSQAVDLAPLPLDWDDLKAFRELAEHIKAIATEEGVTLRWGGEFRTLRDFPHWELAK